MRDFEEKVILITGGSAGIGLEVARQFADLGADLVLVARGQDALQSAAEELRARGAVVHTIAADVGDFADCDEVIAQTIERFGSLYGVVNNAAMHIRGPFAENPADGLAQMVQVNLAGPVYLTRIALPCLAATRGFVVNVASIAGCVPTPGSAVYSATKFGLRALSRALAVEVAELGIRVSVVSPGPVDTGFIMDHMDEVTDLTMSQPISTATEVAVAVLECARDGRLERQLPTRSGMLATMAYLFPGLAQRLRPALERKGRKVRQRLLEKG